MVTPTLTHASPEEALRSGGEAAILAAAGDIRRDLAARAAHHDREGSFALENVEAVWRAGLGNLTLPAEYGGVGATLATSLRAVEAIAAGDASTALVLVMHLAHIRLVCAAEAGCPGRLRDQIVAESLTGPALINALRVEPDLGTPARGGVPATRARLVKDDAGRTQWTLTGHKIYSTGAQGLRWMLVWGATDPGGAEEPQIGWFLVPGDAPGVRIVETWDHLGMRASASHDILFEGVALPFDHGFGFAAPGEQPERDLVHLAWLTALILAVYRGVAGAARDWFLRFLHERAPSNLGAPLASLARFQLAAGEIEALLYASDRVLWGLAADLDRSDDEAREAALRAPLAKVAVTRNLIEAVETAVRMLGNPALTYDHPLQRHYRDILCSRIHTPQDDAVLTFAGRAALEPQKPPHED